MNKKIQTYKDLLEEEERLKALLDAQKDLVVYDLKLVKTQLHPVTNALSLLKKVGVPDKSNPLLNVATKKIVDVVLKKFLLAKAGWLTRLTVPLLVKNYSSHLIAEKKNDWINRLFSWIGPKHQNGKAAPETIVP